MSWPRTCSAITEASRAGSTVSARKQDTTKRWEQSIAGGAHTWSPSKPVISWPQAGPRRSRRRRRTPEPRAGQHRDRQATPIWPQPQRGRARVRPRQAQAARDSARRRRSRSAAAAPCAPSRRWPAAIAVTVLAVLLVTGDDDGDDRRAGNPAPAPAEPERRARAAGRGPPGRRVRSTTWPRRDAYTVVVSVSRATGPRPPRHARAAPPSWASAPGCSSRATIRTCPPAGWSASWACTTRGAGPSRRLAGFATRAWRGRRTSGASAARAPERARQRPRARRKLSMMIAWSGLPYGLS